MPRGKISLAYLYRINNAELYVHAWNSCDLQTVERRAASVAVLIKIVGATMMTMMMLVGCAVSVGCVLAAAGVMQLWVDWIWTPNSLVNCCKRQGIHGISFNQIFLRNSQVREVLQLKSTDVAQSWLVLNSLKNYGKVFYIRLGKLVTLCVTDPVLIRQILINNADCYEKPSFIRSLSVLGDGLFTAAGEAWSHQRQIFEPHFLSREIKRKLDILKEGTVAAVNSWEQYLQSNDKEIDIYQKYLELTLDIFGKFAFGSELRSSFDDIFHSFDRYLHNSRDHLFGLSARLPRFLRFPTAVSKEIKEDEDRLRRIVMDLLEKELVHQHFDPQREDTLLTLMLHLLKNENLTEKQFMDNCVTFLLVGHETTASLLTWTTYLLALYPHWQKKARVEAVELCQKEALEWSDLSRLKTVAMILFESLRMFPPQPLFGRTCVRENTVAQFMIPQKMEVIIPVSVLHHSKEYWGDNADEFRPERFSNGVSGACNNPLAFLPFGLGPRTCIGQAFALAEAKVVLAMLLLKFCWKLSPHYQHCPDVTLSLHPRFGMPIILEKL